MQPKRSPLLLATAFLGVLALGGLAFVFLQPGAPAPTPAQEASPTPTPTPSMHWVAAYNIPPRTRITPGMLKASYKGEMPVGGIKDLADVSGEITNEPIMEGEPVKLASFTQGIKRVVPANIAIPSGMRAVAIYVDPTSTAAGLVDVGDFVDVVAVHKLTWDKGKNQYVVGALQFSTGRLIGSGLEVLAVDKSLAAPPTTPTPLPAQAGQNAEQGPPPTPTPPPAPAGAVSKTRVILAAPVETATRLIAAGDQGVLNITIRNPMDTDRQPMPEVREYPSHVITMRDTTTTPALPKVSSSGPIMPLPPITPMATSAPPVMLPPAAPPMTSPTPAGPPTTDITVIRGTEKTRVIVPQR